MKFKITSATPSEVGHNGGASFGDFDRSNPMRESLTKRHLQNGPPNRLWPQQQPSQPDASWVGLINLHLFISGGYFHS